MLVIPLIPNQKQEEAATKVKPKVSDWHKNATIYEVNLRQFSKEGRFLSFIEDIPCLKKMGIDTL